MSISFRKKGQPKRLAINGTKRSLQNNQLLVSSGIPSMDYMLGGGLAVGTLLLVEEDYGCGYSDIVTKYFIAEGIVCQHEIFICSTQISTEKFISELPSVVTVDFEKKQAPLPSNDTNMKIAWRYQDKPQEELLSSTSQTFSHYYDLNEPMSEKIMKTAKITHHKNNGMVSHSPLPEPYGSLLTHIKQTLEDGNFLSTSNIPPSERNVLRIVLHNLASPLWGSADTLLLFLYAIRSLLRSAFAVCFVSVPTHLFQVDGFLDSLENLSDTAIALDSFSGTDLEHNAALKEYHGFFNIRKLPQLNSIHSFVPDTKDLAFKLKRKRFTVERIHLPPDLSDSVSRDQREKSICSSNNKLEF